ncbi:hypothetical protein KSF_095700 [Reticulibacter mediterranei]|uniref:Uncharacterized protein n=1 Tax=Reticulibacter mediterranei TaxID=2778369 RepID=A0A8J3IZA9_9CHLR|nr:hypothetical protein [Reticulibacter mediterranei]GHO99522.1 hypothetical protein KSF_095700 [Reticulibacter mediterranei]
MDRFEAVQWLQKELEGEGKAASLVDQLQETWQTLDMLGEYLLPETVIELLLAHDMPRRSTGPTVRLDIGLSELFALKAAVGHYDTTLRSSDVGDEEKLALAAVEQLQQRILDAVVQPPTEEQP